MNRVLTVHLELVHVDLVEVELPLAVPHEDGDVLPLPQPGVVTKPAGQVSLEKGDGIVNPRISYNTGWPIWSDSWVGLTMIRAVPPPARFCLG